MVENGLELVICGSAHLANDNLLRYGRQEKVTQWVTFLYLFYVVLLLRQGSHIESIFCFDFT